VTPLDVRMTVTLQLRASLFIVILSIMQHFYNTGHWLQVTKKTVL